MDTPKKGTLAVRLHLQAYPMSIPLSAETRSLQEDVIAFLSNRHNHRPEPMRVGRIDTHCAIIFLAGETVYKIKRAVHYDYIDCSTLAKREALCRRELAINKPHAPSIYRDVIAITREGNGTLAIDGSGQPLEWALRMNRFGEECVLENMAERGALSPSVAADLGKMVARLHQVTETVAGEDGYDLVRNVVDELERVFGELTQTFGGCETDTLDAALRAELERQRTRLRKRARQGFVRRCHGDLHLRNIVRLGDGIVPFDALEFDDRLATTDILYDLAFLLMDMLHRGLVNEANTTFNQYFSKEQTHAGLRGLALIPLFLSIRAAIRAMVSAQAARLDSNQTDILKKRARLYLREAREFLEPKPARLVAVGGLSGTGKSVLARSLAPLMGMAPGALLIRSDVERKHYFHVGETTRLDAPQYASDISREIYRILLEKAGLALEAGHSVVLDAVYMSVQERQAAARLAQDLGVPFHGLWLQADKQILVERVQSRTGDASDADAAIVDLQHEQTIGPMEWHSIDAGGTTSDTLRCACPALGFEPDHCWNGEIGKRA